MVVHRGAQVLYKLASMAYGGTTGPIQATAFVPNAAQKQAMLNGLSGYTISTTVQILAATVTYGDGSTSTYTAYGVVPPSGSGYCYAILDADGAAVLTWTAGT